MNMYQSDKRIVMTLDAGGTNFVFSAMQGCEERVEPITLPSNADNLNKCLATIVDGFKQVQSALKEKPVAISFAFPGPADYPNGIIGDLGNLPAFRGGVALGPMLQDQFKMPVFINNDGDLFAYGEAIAGLLPKINGQLINSGNPKIYKNLLGVTIGTGFGGGMVTKGELFLGDNSAGFEIWDMRNKVYSKSFVEESVSIRGVQRVYAREANINASEAPEPKEIYQIASGEKEGNRAAAVAAFRELAVVAGDCLANAVTLVDGLVVIGGGLAGAHSVFLPFIVEEMNKEMETLSGGRIGRMELKAFNLEDPEELSVFIKGEATEITVPGTNRKIPYDPLKRIGVGVSILGTSKATSVGAYAFALHMLERK